MMEFDIVVDSESLNLINELNNYCWDPRKVETPIDKHNHIIDGARYVIYDNEINGANTLCIK